MHTRLGLLGEFSDEDDEDSSSSANTAKQQSLWVPGTSAGGDERTTSSNPRIKIDHKRQQEKALKRARRATIKNREVPPLRPDVVPRLAQAFPHLQFVANGGIDDLNHVKRIVDGDNNGVLGAMVGRTVINHPCSFAAADWLLWGDDNRRGSSPTRGEILADYIAYCELEEARIMSYGASAAQLEYLRRRLIAVPYHLFTGEQGSDAFQRRIQKLLNKVNNQNPTMKSASVLVAASSFVPRETLDKSIEDFVPWEDVAKFEIGLKRGSALQRVVY